jgi:hypothetical protein
MARSVIETAASWNIDLGRNIFKRVTLVCEAVVFSKKSDLESNATVGLPYNQGRIAVYMYISRGAVKGCLLYRPCPTGLLSGDYLPLLFFWWLVLRALRFNSARPSVPVRLPFVARGSSYRALASGVPCMAEQDPLSL